MERPAFFDQAECRSVDTNIMYPEAGDLAMEAVAKAVCRSCVVVDQCLSYALKHKELQGVWGGDTELERHRRLTSIKTNRTRYNRRRRGA